MKKVFTLLAALLIYTLSSFAQDTAKAFYFPHKTGDMWEYIETDFGFPPDTLQNFTIFDSTDSQGIVHIIQYGRDINPNHFTYFFDTTNYIIDTLKNCAYKLIYAGYKSEYDSFLVYKLDANHGDIWVVYDHSKIGGSSFDLARVIEKKKEVVLGKETTIMKIWYYGGADITDTMGLDMGTVTIANGFGLIYKLVGETANELSLLGAVINDTLYGDTTLVSVNEKLKYLPSEIKLYQNFPNPFNPSTTINFEMIKPSNISLIIYDVLGREIYKLIDNEEFNTGEHNMVWDGTKENGNKAASGIYFYSLISEQQVLTRSMILLK